MTAIRKIVVISFLASICCLTSISLRAEPVKEIQILRDGQGGIRGLQGAQAVTISPDGRYVYASGRDSTIGVYRRDPQSGKLTYVQAIDDRQTKGIRGTSSMAVSPDSAYLYSVSPYDHVLSVFRRTQDGRLQKVQQLKKGDEGLRDLVGPTFVMCTKDGKTVYVAAFLGNTLYAFTRDVKTGRLSLLETETNGVAGTQGTGAPIAVAESPDEKFIYLLSSRDFTLAVFARDTATGKLMFRECEREGVDLVKGLGAARSLVVTTDGTYLFVVGAEGTMTIFRRIPETGSLSFLQASRQKQGNVGLLDGIAGAGAISQSPDGSTLYVAAGGSEAVTSFLRNKDRGTLNRPEITRNGVDGVEGLAGARSLVISPDGAHIYVASARDDTLTVFQTGFNAPH
jgi:6-phosphogluconolactonase (cycloisomerase 2 family)